MPLTNFPNGVSSFGIPVMGAGGIPATKGNVYFVDYGNGSDGNTGKSPTRAFQTLSKANDAVTTNNDDVICLIGNSAHVLTEMLTVSKNRVHFVGVDGTWGRFYGQNAKVEIGVTTATTDVAAVKNTGIRNSFHNIKFISNNTLTQALYTFADAGEYALFSSCEFYKSTHLNGNLAAEFVANGDSSQLVNCTFGSLADETVGAVIRPCVLTTGGTIAGAKLRDNSFSNCNFWRKAGATNARMVYGGAATDVERLLLFKNCSFISNKLGAATPAAAVTFAAAQTEGTVLLQDCCSVDCTIMATAAVGIYVAGAVPTFATTGVSVAA